MFHYTKLNIRTCNLVQIDVFLRPSTWWKLGYLFIPFWHLPYKLTIQLNKNAYNDCNNYLGVFKLLIFHTTEGKGTRKSLIVWTSQTKFEVDLYWSIPSSTTNTTFVILYKQMFCLGTSHTNWLYNWIKMLVQKHEGISWKNLREEKISVIRIW